MWEIIGWVYVIGFFVTWVIAYGMFYRSELTTMEDSPIMLIILSGIIGLMAGMFWPLVIIIFGIHRIATHRVGGGGDASP